MLDLHRIRAVVAEKFFKIFHTYDKPDLSKSFTKRWMELLYLYSKVENFQSFHCKIPCLDKLVPNAKSVLVVQFEDSKAPALDGVSVFPLYPFRVLLKHKSICCKEGSELLCSYLKITGITVVGFYDVPHYKKITAVLKRSNPSLQCYPPSLFKYFRTRHKIHHKKRNGKTFFSSQKIHSTAAKSGVDGSL